MAELVRPNIPKKIVVRHEMILCIKYTTVLYLSKESILQGTHAKLVRPNIQKKIADVRAWDDIMHKVHNGTVFIKGIYTSGNSRMAELVRPNIQKKIADICIHEMILCM